MITAFDWLNNAADIHQYAFAGTGKWNKTDFGFHFFDALYALKYCNDA